MKLSYHTTEYYMGICFSLAYTGLILLAIIAITLNNKAAIIAYLKRLWNNLNDYNP